MSDDGSQSFEESARSSVSEFESLLKQKPGHWDPTSPPPASPPLVPPADPPQTPDAMEQRVTRLEEWAKQADARMGRVENKLDTIIERLGQLPSKGDLRGYLITALVLFIAVATLFVGGMSWLETRAARIAPTTTAAPQAPVMVLQVPPYPTQSVKPAGT